MRTDGPVVIALDGSPRSPLTLEWGLRAAARRGADVVLARAYESPSAYQYWGWYPAAGWTEADTEAKEYLTEVVGRAAAVFPDLRLTTEVLHGPTVPALRTLSEDARLLVVGAGAHGDHRLGRTGAHLVAHARCPVAVVRPERPFSSRHVAVGVDGSSSSLAAATCAADEAAALRVPLRVVHARPTIANPYGTTTPTPASADATTQEAAARLLDRLRGTHPTLEVEARLVDDDPAHALVTAAEDAALLVVGSRGLGAFRGMLLGSVSLEVSRDAPCTVLVHHERDEVPA